MAWVIVIADKYSASTKQAKGQRLYAKSGEKVTVIADYGNVMIVENSSKLRFPILKTEIRFL